MFIEESCCIHIINVSKQHHPKMGVNIQIHAPAHLLPGKVILALNVWFTCFRDDHVVVRKGEITEENQMLCPKSRFFY